MKRFFCVSNIYFDPLYIIFVQTRYPCQFYSITQVTSEACNQDTLLTGRMDHTRKSLRASLVPKIQESVQGSALLLQNASQFPGC